MAVLLNVQQGQQTVDDAPDYRVLKLKAASPVRRI
jgi:hypothetical protein